MPVIEVHISEPHCLRSNLEGFLIHSFVAVNHPDHLHSAQDTPGSLKEQTKSGATLHNPGSQGRIDIVGEDVGPDVVGVLDGALTEG